MLKRVWSAPYTAVFLLATLVGSTLRLAGLNRQSLWTDELYVIWEARQSFARIVDPHIHFQHPPGYRLALHAWLGPGQDETWARLPAALAGLLLIPLAWVLARELWPTRPAAAAASAVLVATSPFLLHYSQDATTYSWTILWVAVSIYCLLRAWRADQAGWWTAWSGSLTLALYSHYFSVFPLALEVVAAGAVALTRAQHATKRIRTRILQPALALLAAAILYSPWVVVLLTQGRDVLGLPLFPLTVNTQIAHWVPTLLLGRAHEGFWQSPGALLGVWAIILIGVAWATWRLWRERSRAALPGLVLVGGWTAAAILGPYLFLRITEPPWAWHAINFASLAVPALLLGLGALGTALPRRAGMAALALWLALAAFQWQAELRAPAQEDWRGVLGTIAARAQPGDRWLAFPAFHAGAAAAYYPAAVPLQGGWFTANGTDPTGAAYWFPPSWTWQGWFASEAAPSDDWGEQLAARLGAATRLWYLAGDGVDGNYPPSPAAERALQQAGWRPAGEWRASPLLLRLYVRGP